MQEESSSGKVWLFAGLGVVAVVAMVLIFFFQARKPELVSAPAAFKRFASTDKTFVCESPVGWDKTTQMEHAVAGGALFTKGGARVRIGSDLMGSLMGDIAAAQNTSVSGLGAMVGVRAQPKPPVEAVHAMGQKRLAADFKNYQEMPAKPFNSQVGDARFSEFTADGGFLVGKVKGYRVTMLGTERRVTVVCQCPEANWPTLQKSFARIIQSVAPGEG